MKLPSLKSISEFLLGLGLAAIVFGGVWLALEFRFAPEPPNLPLPINTETATVLSEPMVVPSFTLINHHGHPFTEKNLYSHWTFFFFGYTYCPDVCPTALLMLNQVDKLLRENKIRVQPKFIFVSVDPTRDTPERLANYVTYFNPTFIGLTGSEEQIQALTRPIGIGYRRAPSSSSDESYLVDHSATILLVDPDGQLRALISPPHDAKAIAKDYQTIINVVR